MPKSEPTGVPWGVVQWVGGGMCIIIAALIVLVFMNVTGDITDVEDAVSKLNGQLVTTNTSIVELNGRLDVTNANLEAVNKSLGSLAQEVRDLRPKQP